MLLQFVGERIVALRPEAVVLHVAVFVGAVRHLVERQVRDLRQRFIQFLRRRLLLRLRRRDRRLQFGDLCHQGLGPRLVLRLLGLADFLRCRVAPGLGLLSLDDGGAAALVDGDQPRRLGGEPAPGQTAIERLRIFANPFDVVHGRLPWERGRPARSWLKMKKEAGGTTPAPHTLTPRASPRRPPVPLAYRLSPFPRPHAPSKPKGRRETATGDQRATTSL